MPSVIKCIVIQPDLALRRPDGSGEVRFEATMELSPPFSAARGVLGGMTEGGPWIRAYGSSADQALQRVMQKLGEVVSAMMTSELIMPEAPGAAPDLPPPYSGHTPARDVGVHHVVDVLPLCEPARSFEYDARFQRDVVSDSDDDPAGKDLTGVDI